MVTFTCNTCGDSLKKKEVSTHFSRKANCRQASSLTCFDCLKEFGQNYDSHTICVSEDQRYSAGGLNGISKNKQQEWSGTVHSHVKSVLNAQQSTLPKSVVNILEYVCKTASIPRKEKQFLNFLRNTHRYLENDMRAAWIIVQEVAKQGDEAKADNTQKNGPKSTVANGSTPTTNGKDHTPTEDKSSQPNKEEVACNDNKGDVDSEQKKKKKKSKKSESSEAEVITTNKEVANDLSESKKQKKKKEKPAETSQISEDIPMEVEEVTAETGVEEEKLSKKEKKLKKKQEKYEAELKAVEAAKANEEEAEEAEEPAVEEGKKKKKTKKQAIEAEENLETDKKKKKRDRTISMAAETEQPKKKNKKHAENDENTEPNDIDEAEPNRKDFNWNSVIVEVLQSQDDKEMSIKRLCKKVVNEYLSSLLEGAHVDEVKATAKFQKKLHKTPGVFVHKDKAKLKVADQEN